jgi:hypothetical protein
MKKRIVLSGLSIMLGAAVSFAQVLIQPQKANERWIGMWQGQLDGQPGVIITLAERDGHLDGTAVFNIVSRKPQPHVIASQPQMLLATTTDGDTLHFQIKAFQGRPDLVYDLKATGDDTAHLKCLNCDGSAESDMVRAPIRPKQE